MPRIRLVPGGQTTTLSATSAWNVEADSATTKWIEWDDVKVLLDADKKFGCLLSEAGTAQAVPQNLWTPMTFDTEEFDHGGYHSTVSNSERITIPSGQKGVYIVGGLGAFVADATGQRQVKLNLNDTTALQNPISEPNPDATFVFKALACTMALLDVGDYVTLEQYQTTAGDLDAISANLQFFAYMLTRVP